MDDLKNLSLDDLAALASEKREALDALFAVESPTDEQVTEAEALGADLEAIAAEQSGRETAAAERAEKFASLKERFAADPEDKGDDEGDEGDEDEGDEDAAVEEASSDEADADADESVTASVKTSTKRTAKQRLGGKAQRPQPPATATEPRVSIVAAADAGFAAGKELDMDEMGVALQNRVRAMSKPSRSLAGADIPMQKYPVAALRSEVPDDLIVNRPDDAMEVMAHAATESRLPGDSLVAAGGWCAPSETIYDLCEGETLEGLFSLPEVTIRRGGINFTKGPQFSDFYGDTAWQNGNGFLQTEAEAIAGETKECFTIDCPEFDEVRLDAVGLCIKVPILTEAGYPELVRRITSGSLTAHQHRLSVEKINRVVALSGTARDLTGSGLGSTASDSLSALDLVANVRRQQFRFGLNSSFEVVLPFWAKSMFKDDLARRAGVAVEAVSDAQVMAHFNARNLAVQFVYGWQPLADDATEYPTTYQALMYPAGTFVAGVADVINLSAVYDAASLQENVYTGTFMEQGLLVAEMCYDSDLVTLPVCNAGRTGASDLTCAPATP